MLYWYANTAVSAKNILLNPDHVHHAGDWIDVFGHDDNAVTHVQLIIGLVFDFVLVKVVRDRHPQSGGFFGHTSNQMNGHVSVFVDCSGFLKSRLDGCVFAKLPVEILRLAEI